MLPSIGSGASYLSRMRAQFGRLFMCYTFHSWCALCVQEIIRDSEDLHSSYFSCFLFTYLQVGGGQQHRRCTLSSSRSRERGFFFTAVMMSDTFSIKPTPPSDFWQSFHQPHTSADLPRAARLWTDTRVLGDSFFHCLRLWFSVLPSWFVLRRRL